MCDNAKRKCPGCHGYFTPVRSDQECCGATCRKRKERGQYVVTEEDRAAMRRAAEAVPIPVAPYLPGTRFHSVETT